jgi:hypothetical protein
LNRANAITVRQKRLEKENSKAESELARFFNAKGYMRFPNPERREREGFNYKKGYEVRLVVKDEIELQTIRQLLERLGFKLGKPFQKANQLVQPIYSKDAVERFQDILNRNK